MICCVLAMGKQHLGPHVVVGYGIKIFWPDLFIASPDHLASMDIASVISFFWLENHFPSRWVAFVLKYKRYGYSTKPRVVCQLNKL